MKEDVFDVLMYLFENYYMEDAEPAADREALHVELLEAGFPAPEITKAFDWLETLANHREELPVKTPASASVRLYNDEECERLEPECRGFLMYLEQCGILDARSREVVIDRVMALQTDEIDLEQLKWVILMVLFSEPGYEAAYAWMEDLVFDQFASGVH